MFTSASYQHWANRAPLHGANQTRSQRTVGWFSDTKHHPEVTRSGLFRQCLCPDELNWSDLITHLKTDYKAAGCSKCGLRQSGTQRHSNGTEAAVSTTLVARSNLLIIQSLPETAVPLKSTWGRLLKWVNPQTLPCLKDQIYSRHKHVYSLIEETLSVFQASFITSLPVLNCFITLPFYITLNLKILYT